MSNPYVEPLVRELSDVIEQAWRREGYAHASFPEIAANALRTVAPHRLDARALLAGVAAGEGQSRYVGVHGSPQIIPVHWRPKFSISLHAWPDEVGTPHCHAWCGAYQVLEGTSISATYAFDEVARVDGKLAFGRLARTRFELLRAGATVLVQRGESMIHGLGYLDRLGISMSVRSNENPASLTYEYFAPGVRVEGTHVDQVVIDTLECIRALASVDPRRAERTLARALESADLRTTFFLMRGAALQLRAAVDTSGLLAVAARRFGAHEDAVRAAIDTTELESTLRIRRPQLKDPAHRALLGILHLAADRRDVERMMQAYQPDLPPNAVIKRCVVEMASTPTGKGSTLLGTPASSSFDAVLSHLVDDPRTECVLAGLVAEYGAESVRQAEPTLRRACDTLRAIPLLRPLFVQPAA